jgi:NurA-like 5'-3' nuclease
MDGSLRSVLIAPRPLAGEGRRESLEDTIKSTKELLGTDVFDRLEERVRSRLTDPTRLRKNPFTAYTLFKEVTEPVEEVLHELFLLEYVEKLMIYKELINASLPKKSLYFISKRGRAQNYFGGLARDFKFPVPSDMTLFQYMTKGAGYSLPIIPELSKSPRWRRLKWLPPSISGLDTFFGELNVAISYVRLFEGGPVIKVEIPVMGHHIPEDDVRRLMDLLAPISAGGYPYPLYEVDRLTRIPNEDMVRLCRALGLNVFFSGREVVGEWRS